MFLKVFSYLHFTFHPSLHVCSNGQRPSAITGVTTTEIKEALVRRKLGNLDTAVILV